MLDFFRNLFSSDFMPHGHCFYWKPEIVWLHVVSDALIAIAYFSIPAILIYFVRRRRDIPFSGLFLLFGGFIFWCGLTHVLNVVTLWYPIYRFDGVAKAVTAFVSVFTVIALVPIIPQALLLRSPRDLEKANRELEKANRDLEIANKKAKESERLKDQFLANVSHELRTPLTLILAPLETLLARPDSTLQTEERGLLTVMHSNAIRLLNMIGGLLDYTRIESKKFNVQREPTDLAALSRSLFEEFTPLFKQKQLRGTIEVDPAGLRVLMDRYLFERILFNLLSNAVKFTESGGSVCVEVRRRNGSVRLSVIDTGIGIQSSDIPLLFEEFRQIDSASTRRFEGSGLGLALVKEFVELLNGVIRVESKVGQGSEFSVELPVENADGKVQEPSKRPRALVAVQSHSASKGVIGRGPARILIAEDNSELADYLAKLAGEYGQVRIASDGATALEIVSSWVPDLVISDVMMPIMDGFELCRRIKQDHILGDTLVVLLTALTDRESLLKGWDAGTDEYLFKPFHPKELETRIRTLLRASADRRARRSEETRRAELEDFAYFASHDLKEPVRIITTFSQLLKRKHANQLGKEGEELLSFVTTGSRRIQALIDDLVSFSKAGAPDEGDEWVDLNQAAAMAVENLKLPIQDSGAEIVYKDLPRVKGTLPKFVQLFQNLLENSIKYRSAGKPRICITVRKDEEQYVFAVKDNGIGFEQRYAEQIFLIFKRLHAQDQYSGTGMGLAICKRIIEQRGGRIWAESRPNEGATFHFTLTETAAKPLAAAQAIQT